MKAVRGKFSFGGVHPRSGKALTASLPIEVMPEPETVCISTSQSFGKPAIPSVEVGKPVKEGELIAKADGALSTNVFASISGTVAEIKEATGASGVKETFIVINKAADGAKEDKFRFPLLSSPTADEIVKRIADCGIAGLGGAGFPTALKAKPATPVDTLIINGAECEPYLTCDHRLMLEKTDEIVRGARFLATALGVKEIAIGIEANKPDAVAAFEPYEDIKVVVLWKKYPVGGERQLAYAVTGRKISKAKIPAECGVVVQNVATCFAICEAVEQGKPLYERVLTVSGRAVKEPKNLWVKVGASFKDIIDYCGGEVTEKVYGKASADKTADNAEQTEKSAVRKVVQGGPMTGVALASYDNYVHKTTSAILLLDKKEAAADEPTPCLNCGKCAEVCPMHLMPMNTAFYSAAGDFEAAEKYGNVSSCIECGSCEFICPARRPLIQAIRKTKAALRKKNQGE